METTTPTLSLDQLVCDMEATPQTAGLSVLGHGDMVLRYFHDFQEWLEGGYVRYQWNIPTWLDGERERLLKLSLEHQQVMNTYLRYHDCGKPYCRIVDAEGKQHFPDHAAVSARTWLQVRGESPFNLQVADLMAKDMDFHLLKPAGAAEYQQQHPDTAWLSWMAAFCEIHANASMFGSTDSVSFKIKYKNLVKCGERMLPATR